MKDIVYSTYGRLQQFYHALKHKSIKDTYRLHFAYTPDDMKAMEGFSGKINGLPFSNGDLLFKGDNTVEGVVEPAATGDEKRKSPAVSGDTMSRKWLKCIHSAKVEDGWKNSGFYLTAYTKENGQWCLSNWIWTSGAIARVLSKCGEKEAARAVSDAFLREQLESGGWIVRYDSINRELVRLAAPNDSAYAARNALLTTYKDTGEARYLEGAERCAQWIMDTCCADGLVYFGYDVDRKVWVTDRNIVDIGFTADLFAELYRLTGKEIYRDFMMKFITAYIKTFYVPAAGLFASHVNGERRQNGGYFSRGQAWAMEGLIAAYSVTKDPELFEMMEQVTCNVMKNQLKDGGWYCNFQKSRALMGEDCKGISAIARSLLDWAAYSQQPEKLVHSAKCALKWCEIHTDPTTGMILSFTSNGAIAHSPNTSTGILYANAYAIEIKQQLEAMETK